LRRDALPHYFIVWEAPIRFVLPPFASAQFKEKPKVPIKEILSDACEVHAGPFAALCGRPRRGSAAAAASHLAYGSRFRSES